MLHGSDGQCLRAARGGDARAFEALVERHQSALLRHARALLGRSGGYEDVVQEVFLRLSQKPPELPPEALGDFELERAHLLAWLHRVTRNCCMDLLRSNERRKVREESASEPEIGRPTSAVLDASEVVEARDTRAAVERSLERLPPDQHEVLVLRLLGGRSYREIADITGKKIGTVGWLVSEGLKVLSRELAPLLALPVPALSDRVVSVSEASHLRGELS